MGYKNYRFKIILRLLVIILLTSFSIYSALANQQWILVFLGAGLSVALIAELVHYVEKSDRELANFLMTIKYSDFSNTYSETGNPSRDQLRKAFNQIMDTFQKLRSEKESHNQYLNTVVEHVGIALLSYGTNGEVQLLNKAFKNLFNKPYIHGIDAIGKFDEQLLKTIKELKAGDKVLLKVDIGSKLLNLSIQATEFTLQGEYHKLVSFQDIKSELEEQEVESWQKLIRVLTHEIMNSVAPISSLASVVNQMLEDEEGNPIDLAELDVEDEEDLRLSLYTIEKRSKGLINFVKAYRSLTQIATPNFMDVSVKELLKRISTLFKADLDKRQIKLVVEQAKPDMIIKADLELIEQILINLITNASHALEQKENPQITLIAKENDYGKPVIQIQDNGSGMSEEVLQNIFIPFYTTKKAGSGIGLSLSKQIMRLHKGSIAVQSEVGQGTVFSLEF